MLYHLKPCSPVRRIQYVFEGKGRPLLKDSRTVPSPHLSLGFFAFPKLQAPNPIPQGQLKHLQPRWEKTLRQ